MMHFQNYFSYWIFPLGAFGFAVIGFLLFILIVWSLVWKGLALWRAAHRSDKVWFAVFLIVNTLGILEVLYIYVFSKNSKQVE